MELRARPIREDEGAGCPHCGRSEGGTGHGIPIGDVVVAIAADPGLLGAMEAGIDGGRCIACDRPSDWDVVTVRNGGRSGRAGSAARRAMLTLIRAQLLLGRRPEAIAGWIRAELGVVGILVEGGAPVGRRLGCIRVPEPAGPAPGTPVARSRAR